MLGFLFGKKNEQAITINLNQVADKLARRKWDFEKVDGNLNRLIVTGQKYRNHDRDFDRLTLQIVGDKVQFKDPFGRAITKIPAFVSEKEMFPTMMNILNVLPESAMAIR